MKLLEERILKDGIVLKGDVLKVGSFLNQQLDVPFLCEACKEFYRLYKDAGVTKILTIEASGIAIAALTAQYFGVPVVFAKKSKSDNIAADVYSGRVVSYTHGNEAQAIVSKEYISKEDRLLLIDDFLARGSALEALLAIAGQAGAAVVGAGIAIEKAYQGGGDALRAAGLRIESLARIASMDEEKGIVFC
ncbi:MAG: xanthine phosphoribosyltransferase [Clostridia bacterium]|nr:xanthine phosphoribosyltransferase [Clostridia bacterium]